MPVVKRKDGLHGLDVDPAALSPEEAREILGSSIRVDPRTGVLEIFGDPIMLFRPAIFVNIQKQLELTVGASTKGILYLSGERSGREGLHLLGYLASGRPEGGADPGYFRRLVGLAAMSGWGRFEILNLDLEGGRIQVALEDSPVARHYGSSKKPVCYFLAGWLAGVAESLFDRELLCEESVCAAQGHPRCEFQLRPTPSG